jgi:ABC-type proline/glycine betaine transport system substrate-binding protein
LTRDDFASSITTLAAAVQAKLMTREEARVYLGWSPEPTIGKFEEPAPTPVMEPGAQPLQLVPGGAADGEDQTA